MVCNENMHINLQFRNARISMADLPIPMQQEQPRVYLLGGSTMHHVNITPNLDFQNRYLTCTHVGVCTQWHMHTNILCTDT